MQRLFYGVDLCVSYRFRVSACAYAHTNKRVCAFLHISVLMRVTVCVRKLIRNNRVESSMQHREGELHKRV